MHIGQLRTKKRFEIECYYCKQRVIKALPTISNRVFSLRGKISVYESRIIEIKLSNIIDMAYDFNIELAEHLVFQIVLEGFYTKLNELEAGDFI